MGSSTLLRAGSHKTLRSVTQSSPGLSSSHGTPVTCSMAAHIPASLTKPAFFQYETICWSRPMRSASLTWLPAMAIALSIPVASGGSFLVMGVCKLSTSIFVAQRVMIYKPFCNGLIQNPLYMITYADRLEWAMKCAGLNPQSDQSELARRVNDGCKPQNIQYLLDHNKNAKSSKYTQHLASVLECDPGWLAYGKGTAPALRQGASVHHISEVDKTSIMSLNTPLFTETGAESGGSMVKDASQRFDQNVAMAQTGQREIPVISYVQAGKMREQLDPYSLGEHRDTITTDRVLSGSAFGMVVIGESMAPKYEDGDMVVIDPAVEPRPGDFVVANNGNEETTLRKYRPRGTGENGAMVFELVPLNDDFPTLQSERDQLQIVGVVMEHRTYRR